MGTTSDALRARALDRQKLMDTILSGVYDTEETVGDRIQVNCLLSALLIQHLAPSFVRITSFTVDLGNNRSTAGMLGFGELIIAQIRKFERSPKEGDDMLWELIQRMVDSSRVFTRELREKEERDDPGRYVAAVAPSTNGQTISDDDQC